MNPETPTAPTTWFSSDHHFGHARIIEYCKRPFSSVWEMDEALIHNHNKVVAPEDDVFFLGDFTFYKDPGQISEIVRRLNGRKTLILGNHDDEEKHLMDVKGWSAVYYRQVEIPFLGSKLPWTLNHFPMLSWNKSHLGAFHLHGHTHGGLHFDRTIRRVDVGVDCWHYVPVPAQMIHDKLSAVKFEKKERN